MKKESIQPLYVDRIAFADLFASITNRPGRRSNPIPERKEEDEEEEPRPGKEDPKRKKKKRAYEVTC